MLFGLNYCFYMALKWIWKIILYKLKFTQHVRLKRVCENSIYDYDLFCKPTQYKKKV